ncbi:MAG: hypothetical protein ABIP51_18920 [Bacteroidia bacterium]
MIKRKENNPELSPSEDQEKDVQEQSTEYKEQIPVKHPHGKKKSPDEQTPDEHPHTFTTAVDSNAANKTKKKRKNK